MTKVNIEVEFESNHDALSRVLENLNHGASVSDSDIRVIEALRTKLEGARDDLISREEWRPLKAGQRSTAWVRDHWRGYVQEMEFLGLEINTLGELRFTPSKSGLVPGLELPTVDWDGDPAKPLADYGPDENLPTGKVSFLYKGHTWYLLIKKYDGPVSIPTVWSTTKEHYNGGPDPLLSI